jgi:hypothetical protein
MDSSTHTTPVDSKIINEDCVAADSKINSDSGVVFGFTLFFFIG